MGPGRIQNSRPRHLTLRRFRRTDAEATYRVFFEAVRDGTVDHYGPAERTAWAASTQMPDGWPARLERQQTRVALQEGRIVGFMSLRSDGYLDLAFVLPRMMGTGVAQRLYEMIEEIARKTELKEMTTEASHLAKSFFSKHGWHVVKTQTVITNGHEIANFAMAKALV